MESKFVLRDQFRDNVNQAGQTSDKPPQGIIPRFVMEEIRLMDLREVILRYLKAGCKILPEWVEEYNELLERVSKKVKE